MLKDIPGFNGKYVMNENKEVFNKKTGKAVKAKILGASANPSYRLYGSEHFGASKTGLERNLKSKGCEIKSVTTSPMGRRAESDYRSKCDTPKG